MPQAAQRGRNQEGMQPVGVRLHAVAVVTGSHPRRLVPPQARPRRGTVPPPRHGPSGQARAVGGAVPRAPGVEPPVLGVAPPSDGMGGAVGRRTRIGRRAVSPQLVAYPLDCVLSGRPEALTTNSVSIREFLSSTPAARGTRAGGTQQGKTLCCRGDFGKRGNERRTLAKKSSVLL